MSTSVGLYHGSILFIINKENATAKDVIKLMEYTKEQVYKKFGKTIEAEIEIL